MSFDIRTASPEIQDLYFNAKTEYKDIIESIFNPIDGVEIDKKDRPTPPYAKGTLDNHVFSGGMPRDRKARTLVNAILSGNYRFVEIEGGVRGGKDIYALFGWSKYLMSCPDKTHLALGSSLEHVLRTVLMSNGFGLYFLIPHGVFVRETINGAQRGVYKFLDNYGLEKQILFYGNEKENDKTKFQGFTLGSVYINETLNQHVEGIMESNNRMASVRQPLMIMTQNPRGKAHPFYVKFEKQRITTLKNVERMEYIRDNYKQDFELVEKAILKDRDEQKRIVINSILKDNAVSKIQDLPVNWQIRLNQMLLDLNYEFDKIIRDLTVEDFAPLYLYDKKDWNEYLKEKKKIIDRYEKIGLENSKDCENEIEEAHSKLHAKYPEEYLINKSMKKICYFNRGAENGNTIKNAYDFYYAHFTIEDNLSMSKMQRNDFKNTYAKGTSVYDQSVLGLRRSTDSAVFSMFLTNDYFDTPRGNLMSGDVDSDDFKNKYYGGAKTYRVMALDKGLNHPNGIIDADVNFEKGIIYQCGESLLDVKQADVVNLGLETIYQEVLRVIRSRSNRVMPIAIIVDPSAIETYIYLQQKGLPVVKGNNAVFKVRGEESIEANKLQDKDLIGIPLMQTAIAKFKYLVHENCVYTIEQLGSYEAPFDEKSGKEKVVKVNDDLVDPLRYLFNQYIRMSMWEGEKQNDTISVSKDVGTESDNESEERISARDFIKAFANEFPQLELDETTDFDGFFNGNDEEFW